MDVDEAMRRLAEARERLVRSLDLVMRQRELVSSTERAGRDAELARELLARLEASLELMVGAYETLVAAIELAMRPNKPLQ